MKNNINSFGEMIELKHIIIMSYLCTFLGNIDNKKHMSPFDDNENDDLWLEEVQAKLCKKDHEKYSDVKDHKDCQQRCLANSDCVGISYSHKSSSEKYCYVCYSDELSDAFNDFGFYRRPVPRLIGPRLEYISSSGKRIHFAEIAKQSKNEIQGNVPSNRIGFGEPAKQGELPYQVFLLLEVACGNIFIGVSCGGTLISDRNENQWIVTAAHCINSGSSSLPRDQSNFTLRVRAGSIDSYNRKHERIIPLDSNHIIFHPDWKGSNDESSCQKICDTIVNSSVCSKCSLCQSTTFSDVALLKIDEAFEDKLIRPIKMEYDLISKDQHLELKEKNVIISGWGQNENRTYERFLMKQYTSVGTTEKRVIELSHRAGHGACKGDSGGPAVYKCTQECAYDTDILVATSSFTYYNKATGCNTNTVSYYTNILLFTDWIKNTMKVATLNCLQNDGDGLKSSKACDPKDEFCYFKNKGAGTSSVERGCTDKDDFKGLRNLFHSDNGCFICTKQGGCKDNDRDEYEDMDENEIKCFCDTENCNGICNASECLSTATSDATDVERCSVEPMCRADRQPPNNGTTTNESTYKPGGISGTTTIDSTSKPYLECLDNDGDETQKTKPCKPDDQYCYFKNDGKELSNIERDCADRGDLDKLRRLFNEDVGCFICRKPGGCKHVGIDSYEDMDENEIQCFCQEARCNGQCEITMCEVTSGEAGTDVEFCPEGCTEPQSGGNGSASTTNGFGTNEDSNGIDGTTVGGGNIPKVTQLWLLSLMFVTTACLFHPF